MEHNKLLSSNINKAKTIDYSRILQVLWSRWYWVAACILAACLFTYAYLWYTPSLYSTSASLKFDTKEPELPGIIKSSASFESSNRLQSETYVIQSREVLLNAISKVDYQISFFLEGRVRTSETYPFVPFPVLILQQDSADFFRGMIAFRKLDEKHFKIIYNETEKEYLFGERVQLPGVAFSIKEANVPADALYSFKFNRKEDFLGRVNSGLSMREAAKSSNVLLVSLVDRNPIFAADILNAILIEYINYDLSQKRISGDQTIDFINSQLDFLNKRVEISGTELENFKKKRQILNPSSNSSLQVSKLTEIQSQLNTLEIEGLYIQQLLEQVSTQPAKISYNLNLEGKTDALLSNLIYEFNILLSQKQKNLSLYTPDSEPIKEIDRQIGTLKDAIVQNIKALKNRNQTNRTYYFNQLQEVNQELYKLPADEKEFVNLKSNFETDQTVFQLLSQKKLEAQITRAAVVPGAVTVEKAGVGSRLISPVPGKMYTYGIMIGFFTSIVLIIAARLLNPYIYDKNTVEDLSNVPIIGIIRKFPDYIDQNNTQTLSLSQPKSVFAESVRSVRTNLSFLASEKDSKVICITSEVSGEGKSFVSVNLASTLALIEKKVILIAADLRKSKLHRTFGVKNQVGLSTYLSNQSTVEDIILHSDNNGLDFITSGPVPPNPSELLHSERLKILLEELKKTYDFILIDTAPVGLVSDAIPLIRQSDINAFIIRAGVSRFNAASIPERLTNEYHLNNVVIILNAFGNEMLHSSFYSSSYNDRNYSYYYYADYNGYGYEDYFDGKKLPKWWQLWKKLKA